MPSGAQFRTATTVILHLYFNNDFVLHRILLLYSLFPKTETKNKNSIDQSRNLWYHFKCKMKPFICLAAISSYYYD